MDLVLFDVALKPRQRSSREHVCRCNFVPRQNSFVVPVELTARAPSLKFGPISSEKGLRVHVRTSSRGLLRVHCLIQARKVLSVTREQNKLGQIICMSDSGANQNLRQSQAVCLIHFEKDLSTNSNNGKRSEVPASD